MIFTQQITQLESKRLKLHEYVLLKLEEKDYHAVADGAMDLRELETALNIYINMEKRIEELK